MKFSYAFWKTLRSRPGQALAALYWYALGKRVRARNRLRVHLAQRPDAYQLWIDSIERSAREIPHVEGIIAQWPHRPLLSIILHQSEGMTQEDVERLVQSLEAQIYPHWELIVVPSTAAPSPPSGARQQVRMAEPRKGGAEALVLACSVARGDYVLPLSQRTLLPSTSLFRYAEALNDEPGTELAFGDNDWIDERHHRRRPWLKPQWNIELALAQDYLSQAFIVATPIARSLLAGGVAGDSAVAYALALAAADRPDALIRHIAHIQAHLVETGNADNRADRLAVVRAHLEATGRPIAKVVPGPHGTVKVEWPLPEPPELVSIIVPTRDRVDLLRACLSSLYARTAYPAYEVIVVDNGSKRADTLDYLGEIAKRDDTRILRDDSPYNYSQLNNRAAAIAKGTYLCLLNNDTEVIDGEWLGAMMRQAVRPHVGAVGARLLYEDGSIQHAGVTVGLGMAAGHAHRFLAHEAAGYFARSHTAHHVSAVTAACLVVAKAKFDAVGGLDERCFAVAFNDVDLCLKLREAGWSNLYTPEATLIHYESKSRGKDHSREHIERYRKELATLQDRWGTRDYHDPLHHKYLDATAEEYILRL